jgi:heme exporter protein D
MNWSQFFGMGGYATYVWSAYGIAALVLIFNILSARLRERSVRRELEELARSQDNRDE